MAVKKKATKVKKATATARAKATAKKSPAKRGTTVRKATKANAKTAKAKTKAKPVKAKAKPAKTKAKTVKAKASAIKKTKAKSKAKTTGVAKPAARKSSSLALPTVAITQKQTKAQIFTEIAEMTELNKNDVKNVFSALKNLVQRNLKPKGFGQIIIPELGIKVRRVQKKATKSRMGRNPFTGEEIKIPAKPASKSVRATALKALKELIA